MHASERNTRERELRREDELKRKRKRKRGRSGGGDSGSDRVGIEHVLRRSSFSIRARSSSLPSSPPYYFSASSSYTSSDLTKVSLARLPFRRPYAKCIYVLCKASNRRWPREPDAQCVINTDALVVPFPPTSPPVPFVYSSFQSVPCLCRSSRASETHRPSR